MKNIVLEAERIYMDLTKRRILLHGGQEISILSPNKLNENITLANDTRNDYCMISNGTGYSFLSEIFALGISLQKNELLFLPFIFRYTEVFDNKFPYFSGGHYSGLVLINYCTTQFDSKDIITALKTKIYLEEPITRKQEFSNDYVERWKTHHRTTVKRSGSYIIISTNADGFTPIAQSCSELAGYGDDIQNNDYPPHEHHDMNENTSKSLGITLYYWQPPETPIGKK